MYRPSISARERVLLFGEYGAGKTSAVLSLAEHLPDDHFYVIDNDDAYERMLAGRNINNVTVESVGSWQEHVTTIAKFLSDMTRDDWLVIDSVSEAWESVQDWWIEATRGESPADYFTQLQRDRVEEGKGSGGGISMSEWGYIKKEWKQRLTLPLLRCPGHLLYTARLGTFSGDEDKQIVSAFASLGAYPKGEKNTSYQMHTVLQLGKGRSGGYAMTTAKDRERRVLKGEGFEDWFNSYIVGVAKWRPTSE